MGQSKIDTSADGRDESENERMDRNWNELLQELRVTQTGTQILFGFLLAVAFQPQFDELDRFQLTVYLILVVLAATTTALALAPVSLHRGLFRQGRKAKVVRLGHILVVLALIGVGLTLTGTTLLIFDVTVGRPQSFIAAVAALIVLAVVGLLPRLIARR
jgi:hypothetical protein